jgi:integrase/recombinase XerD
VRGFARYCKAIDPRTEIPPIGLLPKRYQRPRPYLFTDGDISRLLDATKQISPKNVFAGQVLYCLFGLVSVTGLRINEALNLTIDAVDLETGVLTIRHAKFGKSRLLPLHKTTVQVLAAYKEQRATFLAGHQSPYVFVSRLKEQLGYDCVRYHFDILMRSICPIMNAINRKPHLHDLRHNFALSVLIKWYRNGQDVERCLPILSAYLGHVETRDTYWYLSACPELMGAANLRLEQHWEAIS